MDNITVNLYEEFKRIFKHQNNLRLFFAPGRVNLIGEHTDYNGGHVFPCALNIGTYLMVSPRKDKICNLYSYNFANVGIVSIDLASFKFDKSHDWANYPKGVIQQYINLSMNIPYGFDALFYGNIPNGAGLSSSASIEVVTATMINTMYQFHLDPIKIALLSQAAENEYIGVKCGIMDQFASSMGKQNMAILLDCNTLNYQYSHLNINDYKLVIANSNKRRGLLDSKYNERLSECQLALKLLQKELAIKSLGQIDLDTLEKHKYLIEDDIIYKRARHAVSENQRTLVASQALNNNDLLRFGQLMKESHISLRDDYQVTGNELDSLVSAAWQHHGCIGARMTGAGFGGCTVNLVSQQYVDDFIACVGREYKNKVNLSADFYVVEPSAGAHEMLLSS